MAFFEDILNLGAGGLGAVSDFRTQKAQNEAEILNANVALQAEVNKSKFNDTVRMAIFWATVLASGATVFGFLIKIIQIFRSRRKARG